MSLHIFFQELAKYHPKDTHRRLGVARHSESGELYEVFARLALPSDTRQLPHLPSGWYRHYKDRLYLVIGIAFPWPEGLAHVLYVPKYVHEGPGMSLRPLRGEAGFLKMVEVDGSEVARFCYLGNELPAQYLDSAH